MIARIPKYVWWLLASLMLGWLALPGLAYVLGRQVIGRYEGDRGLASYAGSIYAAAGEGRPLAMVMVFAPTLLLGIWALHNYLRRQIASAGGRNTPAGSTKKSS
jgi:hypothetical protein